MSLYKTTIVIWSEFDPDMELELEQLAREAMTGEAYCSRMRSELVEDPTKDPDWDGTEFFDLEDKNRCKHGMFYTGTGACPECGRGAE